MKSTKLVAAAAAVALVGVSLAAVSTSTAGAAGKTLIISSDLPLQGASADASRDTNRAMEL